VVGVKRANFGVKNAVLRLFFHKLKFYAAGKNAVVKFADFQKFKMQRE